MIKMKCNTSEKINEQRRESIQSQKDLFRMGTHKILYTNFIMQKSQRTEKNWNVLLCGKFTVKEFD